jgi:DNA-binding CsgD family transcriptional regulator
MSKIININNILYTKTNIIYEFNKIYNANRDFELVDYCRLYNSGHIKTIALNPDLIKSYYIDIVTSPDKMIVASSAFIEAKSYNNKHHIHLLKTDEINRDVASLFSYHKINNLLTLTFHHDDYSDLFSFKHTGSTYQAIADYLNNIEFINQSIALLKAEHSYLFDLSDNDLIPLNKLVMLYIRDHFNNIKNSNNHAYELNSIWKNWCDNYGVSNREQACFKLILQGLSGNKIAENLKISSKTVENHIARLRRKTGAASRSHMIDMFKYLK